MKKKSKDEIYESKHFKILIRESILEDGAHMILRCKIGKYMWTTLPKHSKFRKKYTKLLVDGLIKDLNLLKKELTK